MKLKASMNGRYSINVIDVDYEKNLADFQLKESDISKEEYETRMRELNSMLPFIESNAPSIIGYDSLLPYYEIEDDSIVQKWEVTKNDSVLINRKIKDLKSELSQTDYQVTKCYEATLLHLSLPYDIGEVHTKRQEIRDNINKLEELIASNK